MKTVLEIHKHPYYKVGGYQLSISEVEDDGSGTGFRVFGPKFDGSSILLDKKELNIGLIEDLEWYLKRAKKHLKGKK
jgi:hypothetical protein